MASRIPTPPPCSSAFAFLTLLALWACSSPTAERPSTFGEIEVTVMSVGDGTLPDSLVVLLNGMVSGTVSSNGVYAIPFLPADRYFVGIRDEWEGCRPRNNHRSVTVERNEVTATTFIVQCGNR